MQFKVTYSKLEKPERTRKTSRVRERESESEREKERETQVYKKKTKKKVKVEGKREVKSLERKCNWVSVAEKPEQTDNICQSTPAHLSQATPFPEMVEQQREENLLTARSNTF